MTGRMLRNTHQLSRDLECQYKTAFVLAQKLREAMAMEVHTGEVLEGHVEIDGAYFGVISAQRTPRRTARRVSDLLCMSNLAHASLTKEHDDNDDIQGSFRRAAERR
ncbi:hypothetical protein SAMN04488512_13911 [Sulfitobacter litoralis]|uniref:Uncharacterized protein n=1 Tax=Sulfitobacter litoralis TaxID=335975 RepID=A0ABY0SZ53_9RHOB|nr:hypothetical protein SAMN04488512_13911 [Sulfitobacter litoralis]